MKTGQLGFIPSTDPLLHSPAQPLPVALFGSEELRGWLKEMNRILAGEPDGVALAAPQVGLPWRLFIVSARTFGEEPTAPALIFINPQITRRSRKKAFLEEGCLSVRPWYGLVERAERATVAAFDEKGQPFTRHGNGLLAQIFQHEIDHLDGILFTDKAKDLHKVNLNEQ
jgi:peptide deformylase